MTQKETGLSAISPRRIALLFLVASLVVSALLGIVVLLWGEFGEVQVKVLLTSLSVSAGAICALACAARHERLGSSALALIGGGLAVAAVALLVYGLWMEPREDIFWKTVATLWTLAVASGLVCLLSLARLAPRFLWISCATYIAVWTLASFLIALFWWELDDPVWARLMGVASILVALLTILVPIFHKVSAVTARADQATAALPAEIRTLCPACGREQTGPPGPVACPGCGCRYEVVVLEPGRAAEASAPKE